MSEISSVIIVLKPFAVQINGCFLCYINTSLKWQRGCMVKVNINFYILLIDSSSIRNVKYNLEDDCVLFYKQE